MDKWQRTTLIELYELTNLMGGTLDATSTSPNKYQDRQKCLGKVSVVLYAVLSKHPDNDDWEHTKQQCEEAMQWIRDISKKNYPDRNGNY